MFAVKHYTCIDDFQSAVKYKITAKTIIFDKIVADHAPPPRPKKENCIGRSSISLQTATIPKRNEKQRLCNFFFWGGGEEREKAKCIMGDG